MSDHADQLLRAYRGLFAGPDGEAVLQDLRASVQTPASPQDLAEWLDDLPHPYQGYARLGILRFVSMLEYLGNTREGVIDE